MDEYKQLEQRAIRLLARREHSRLELQGKLSRYSESPSVLNALLDKLVEVGYLSDSRYAQSLVRQRASQGYGELRVRQELAHKGVNIELIEAALAELNIDWFASAALVKNKKYRQSDSYVEKQKAVQGLCRRGFTYEQAVEAVNSSDGYE